MSDPDRDHDRLEALALLNTLLALIVNDAPTDLVLDEIDRFTKLRRKEAIDALGSALDKTMPRELLAEFLKHLRLAMPPAWVPGPEGPQ